MLFLPTLLPQSSLSHQKHENPLVFATTQFESAKKVEILTQISSLFGPKMAPSFNWWAKEAHRGTPVVVKMENPNWSMVEISSPDEDGDVLAGEFTVKKGGRGKNAKQITWVLLLKAHRAAGCLTSLASAGLGLASAVRHRVQSGRTDSEPDSVSSGPEESPAFRGRFYGCIKIFLWLSVVLLGFEIAAYFKGWHIGTPDLQRLMAFSSSLGSSSFGVQDAFDSVYSSWVRFRVEYLAPLLQFLADACVVLFLIQSADRLILCLGCFWIKFKRIKPVATTMTEAKDPEKGGEDFPMVLIQMPMCNEKEVRVVKLDQKKKKFNF